MHTASISFEERDVDEGNATTLAFSLVVKSSLPVNAIFRFPRHSFAQIRAERPRIGVMTASNVRLVCGRKTRGLDIVDN